MMIYKFIICLLEHHVSGEKELYEYLRVGVDDSPKWDFVEICGCSSIVQHAWHPLLEKKEVYLMEELL